MAEATKPNVFTDIELHCCINHETYHARTKVPKLQKMQGGFLLMGTIPRPAILLRNIAAFRASFWLCIIHSEWMQKEKTRVFESINVTLSFFLTHIFFLCVQQNKREYCFMTINFLFTCMPFWFQNWLLRAFTDNLHDDKRYGCEVVNKIGVPPHVVTNFDYANWSLDSPFNVCLADTS